jgi:hypothetical protein
METRAFTEDEVREKFVGHVRMLIDYWTNETHKQTVKERLEGLAHSMLATIDGCSMGLPSFILAPNPHPDDKKYHEELGDNHWPVNEAEINCNISGGLHEILFNK